jgi:hypothetical protein
MSRKNRYQAEPRGCRQAGEQLARGLDPGVIYGRKADRANGAKALRRALAQSARPTGRREGWWPVAYLLVRGFSSTLRAATSSIDFVEVDMKNEAAGVGELVTVGTAMPEPRPGRGQPDAA